MLLSVRYKRIFLFDNACSTLMDAFLSPMNALFFWIVNACFSQALHEAVVTANLDVALLHSLVNQRIQASPLPQSPEGRNVT
jgi:hypothetical protein